MPHLKPHHVVSVTLVMLALAVTSLLGGIAHELWRSYQEARAAAQASRLADRLVGLAGRYAYERGYTAALLGAAQQRTTAVVPARAELDSWRRESDARWLESATTLETMPVQPARAQAVGLVRRHWGALQDLRRRMDRTLSGAGPAVGLGEWRDGMTALIESIAQLWERGVQGREISPDLAQLNLRLRREAWLLAEMAGRERMLLGYYLGARRPLPADALAEARTLRAAQRERARELWLAAVGTGADTRVFGAVETAQEQLFGTLERTREAVYRHSAHGDYPLSAGEWLRTSSAAIAAIQPVSAAIADITEEHAFVLGRRLTLQLAGVGTLLAAMLALVVAALARVRRMQHEVARSRALAHAAAAAGASAASPTVTAAVGASGDGRPGSPELAAMATPESRWAARLRAALAEQRFTLHCQLVRPLKEGQVPHYEVLIRYRDSDSLILPGVFLPAAEQAGLMKDIDRWVIGAVFAGQRACRERFAALGCADAVSAINLSTASLRDPQLPAFAIGELERHGASARHVCFEIAESAVVDDPQRTREAIAALKGAGFRVTLDGFGDGIEPRAARQGRRGGGFGTGLPSAADLKKLDLDYLKISGDLVREMTQDPAAAAMVQAVVTAGHALGLGVIAQYVATEEVLAQLTGLGVDYVQGYAVSRPASFEACYQELERAAARRARSAVPSQKG
jgi:EAL domain-containing protein (putative c-di-GMP-specific phosphodiesterase class I)